MAGIVPHLLGKSKAPGVCPGLYPGVSPGVCPGLYPGVFLKPARPAPARGTRVAVAPMMAWTDHFFRVALRHITPEPLLYTEMVHAGALLYGKGQPERRLYFDPIERPLALQLGDGDPERLARAAACQDPLGFDELNFNLGCPSKRVQSGHFGACLMTDPQRVAACLQALQANTTTPVTVKIRCGVDQADSFEFLAEFVSMLAGQGVRKIILHARKALLKASPRQNRRVPPIEHEKARRLKRSFPDLKVVFNGEIRTAHQVQEALEHFDGVMIGRAICQNPLFLWEIAPPASAAATPPPSGLAVLRRMRPWFHRWQASGFDVRHYQHVLNGLVYGRPDATKWRRFFNQNPSVEKLTRTLENALETCSIERTAPEGGRQQLATEKHGLDA